MKNVKIFKIILNKYENHLKLVISHDSHIYVHFFNIYLTLLICSLFKDKCAETKFAKAKFANTKIAKTNVAKITKSDKMNVLMPNLPTLTLLKLNLL